MRVDAATFLARGEALRSEAFGNVGLVVEAVLLGLSTGGADGGGS